MTFFKYLIRMIKEQRLKMVFALMMMVLVALMEGATVALLVPLLNMVMGQSTNLSGALGSVGQIVGQALAFFHIKLSLVVVLIMVVTVFVMQSIFRLIMLHFQNRMQTNYEASLVHRLFSSYFLSSWGFFVRNPAGHLMNVLNLEVGRASGAFKTVCDFLSSFLIALFYIILSLLLSWQITLAGLALSFIATIVFRRFMRQSHTFGIRTSRANSDMQSFAFDKISAAKLVKSSASEQTAIKQMDILTRRRIDLAYRAQMNIGFFQSAYQPVAIAILALVAYFALVTLKLSPSVILVFTYIFFRLTPYFSSLQSAYQQAMYYLPAIDVIEKTVESAKNMAETIGTRQLTAFTRDIVFENVNFNYQDGTTVLKNVNLQIKKGESVAIIGESGAGKTTLIDLLLGLYAPASGRIMVDGFPLDTCDLSSWRRLIGHMSQDTILFHDTVEANLKWGAPEATQEQIEAAAKAAHAYEFIQEAPQKYNTVVGDRGVKFSGGQRQRLALTRVMLQDPEIVVLDEATSALDAESEAKVQDSIEQLVKNRTLIVISHRVSMLRNIDRIYHLEAGNVTELDKKAGA